MYTFWSSREAFIHPPEGKKKARKRHEVTGLCTGRQCIRASVGYWTAFWCIAVVTLVGWAMGWTGKGLTTAMTQENKEQTDEPLAL